MDDDKIYLNYGDAQVELLAFLKAAADSVESYLSELPWSNKRKLLFRNAYSDLMTRGILGASNSTGSWKVQYGGDPVDLDSKSEKEKEMYGEAAYFIQQLMSGLASAKPLELLKKSNVPVFSNDEFNSQLELWIGKNMFGAQKDWTKLWVELDNNNNGIYDTSEREKILAKQLRSFGEYVSKNPDKFNFEGSAYDNLDDFLNRINNAATSLETKGYDRNDINALNLLGLNPSNYFYTGANRMVTLSNGTLMTLLEYNDLMAKLQSKLNIPEQQTIYNSDILPQEESRESRDAKITEGMNKALDEINWGDIKFDFNFGKGDLLPNFISVKNDEYLANELNGAIYDILSIADPEAFSGSALALKAANLREKNRPSGISWEKALDYGSAVLGGVLGLGDAALATKIMTRLGKILVNSTRAVGILSAIVGTAESGKAAIEVINKLARGEMPTLAEAQTLIVGLAGGVKGYRARNKAIAKEKYVRSKLLPTREQKYIELETTSGEKIEVELDASEANALGEAYRNAETNAKGRLQILSNDKIKRELDSRGLSPDDVKISGEAGKRGDFLRKIKKPTSPVKSKNVADNGASYTEVKNPVSRFSPVERWLLEKQVLNRNVDGFSFRKFGRRLWGSSEPEIIRKSPSSGGISSGSGASGSSSSAGISDSGSSSSSASSSSSTGASSSTGSSATNRRKTWDEINREGSKWKMSDTQREYKELLKKHSGNKLSLKAFKIGNGKVNSFQVKKLPTASEEGILKIRINGKKESIRFKNQENLRMKVLELLRANKIKTSEHTGKFLRGLSTHGILKQGGTIDKQKIQRYKEFIKK